MKKTVLCSALLAALGLAACGGEAPKPADQPPATAPATTAAAAPAAPAGEAEFGVAECDSYLKAYMACVESKVPEAARAQMRAGLEQSKQAWKQAAATPQGKAGLAMACTQAREAAKTALKAYGCEL